MRPVFFLGGLREGPVFSTGSKGGPESFYEVKGGDKNVFSCLLRIFPFNSYLCPGVGLFDTESGPPPFL